MTKYVVGPKILKKEQVLITIFLIAILVLSSGSMVAFAKSNTYVVTPNHHDDTAGIQNAFNACGSTPGCTVQLVKGTYYISQIVVNGFQGKFVGMGQGVTIIQALPNLPSPTANPYWTALPGPFNPWPVLFTFVGGSISVSGMTINEPYSKALPLGYTFPTFGPTTSLQAAILVTGQQANAAIDHVTVLGTSGDNDGTNVFWAIQFAGWLLPSVYSDPLADTIMLSGTFSVTGSTFNSVNNAVWAMFLADSSVTVCGNTITNSPVSLSMLDVSNTRVTFCGNHATGMLGPIGNAVQLLQSIFKTGLSPSTAYVTGNVFYANTGGVGVALEDFGTPTTLNAVVTGNVIKTDSSCGCYAPSNPAYSAIVAFTPVRSLVVSQNIIFGGGTGSTSSNGIYVTGGPAQVSGNIITGSFNGIWVDVATNIQVTHNTILGSANYGIALTDGSSNNLVAHNIVVHSVVDDLYQDVSSTGTGNVWQGNFCSTSSPSGLC